MTLHTKPDLFRILLDAIQYQFVPVEQMEATLTATIEGGEKKSFGRIFYRDRWDALTTSTSAAPNTASGEE